MGGAGGKGALVHPDRDASTSPAPLFQRSPQSLLLCRPLAARCSPRTAHSVPSLKISAPQLPSWDPPRGSPPPPPGAPPPAHPASFPHAPLSRSLTDPLPQGVAQNPPPPRGPGRWGSDSPAPHASPRPVVTGSFGAHGGGCARKPPLPSASSHLNPPVSACVVCLAIFSFIRCSARGAVIPSRIPNILRGCREEPCRFPFGIAVLMPAAPSTGRRHAAPTATGPRGATPGGHCLVPRTLGRPSLRRARPCRPARTPCFPQASGRCASPLGSQPGSRPRWTRPCPASLVLSPPLAAPAADCPRPGSPRVLRMRLS